MKCEFNSHIHDEVLIGPPSKNGVFRNPPKYISSVSIVLLIALSLLAVPVMAAPSLGTVARSFSATSVAPGGTVVVTVTPGNLPAGGYFMYETIPAGLTFVSTTAFASTVVGNVYTFKQIAGGSFTYTLTAPAATGPYTFGGTFKDMDLNTGTVGGATSVTVGAGGTGTVTGSSTVTVPLTPAPTVTIKTPTITSNQKPVTTKPVTTVTTVVPASPEPSPGFPVVLVVVGVAGVIVLIAGIVLIRRWLIRRQNPALFRKYD